MKGGCDAVEEWIVAEGDIAEHPDGGSCWGAAEAGGGDRVFEGWQEPSQEEEMTERRPQHPSGKPIRQSRYGVTSRYRIPDDGPVTPRLRPKDGLANPIGFNAEIVSRDDDSK